MGTSVAKEYERVQTAYGYSNEIMTNITRMAIEHAFITPAEKEELYAKL
jgi:adenosine deaminase